MSSSSKQMHGRVNHLSLSYANCIVGDVDILPNGFSSVAQVFGSLQFFAWEWENQLGPHGKCVKDFVENQEFQCSGVMKKKTLEKLINTVLCIYEIGWGRRVGMEMEGCGSINQKQCLKDGHMVERDAIFV